MIEPPLGATAPVPVTQRPGAERAGFGRAMSRWNTNDNPWHGSGDPETAEQQREQRERAVREAWIPTSANAMLLVVESLLREGEKAQLAGHTIGIVNRDGALSRLVHDRDNPKRWLKNGGYALETEPLFRAWLAERLGRDVPGSAPLDALVRDGWDPADTFWHDEAGEWTRAPLPDGP